MDLSKITRMDQEEEARVKVLLELSTKRYNLQKELESLKVKFAVKTGELEGLKKRVVSLQLEQPVLEKQEEIMKKSARDSLRLFVVESARVRELQERVWGKINDFVSEANVKLGKTATPSSPRKKPKKERQLKTRQLKLEGEIEALQSYEKFQTAKIEELKLVQELLADDSFVI